MYLKKTPNPHGRIRLSIVDTYYDKVKKCSRQKTVESLGWLDELEEQYDDPIAHFTERVAELNKEKKERQALCPAVLPFSASHISTLKSEIQKRVIASCHKIRNRDKEHAEIHDH